jgi:hypothetical protein
MRALVLSLTAYSAAVFLSPVTPIFAGGTPETIHTQLVGKVVTEPVVVQGQGRTTLVVGNTLVNSEKIVSQGAENSSMLEMRLPQNGGRVIYKNNRVINRGPIVHKGGEGVAAMTILSKEPWQSGEAEVENNESQNTGTIKGYR